MRKKSEILVIIPAYNEEKDIGVVIKKTRSSLPGVDIVVVDDGSTDVTSRVARDAGATVLSHSINLGPGAAAQTGFKYALGHSYEYVVQLDADGQHEPQYINDLLAALQSSSADVVIGSRFLGVKGYQPPWIRRMGMTIFGGLTSLIIGQRITDSTSGFRALRRGVVDFFASIDYPCDYQDADVIVLAHFAGFHIKEVPVAMHANSSGNSVIGGHRLLYYGFKVLLSTIVTLLREKPGK
jgi:glycosyltransferase involved in cell wall biosynthesis